MPSPRHRLSAHTVHARPWYRGCSRSRRPPGSQASRIVPRPFPVVPERRDPGASRREAGQAAEGDQSSLQRPAGASPGKVESKSIRHIQRVVDRVEKPLKRCLSVENSHLGCLRSALGARRLRDRVDELALAHLCPSFDTDAGRELEQLRLVVGLQPAVGPPTVEFADRLLSGRLGLVA